MAKKLKLLVITPMYPTKANPTAGIFIKNQYDLLKKYCDIKIIFPYPYVPKFRKFNPYHKFSTVPFKEVIDGIEVYHPKYPFFPRLTIHPGFLSVALFFETFFLYLSSKKLIQRLDKEWGFDLIKIHGCITESITGVSSKKRYKKPLLVMLHGEDITRYSKIIFLRFFSKMALRNSDAIICKSRSLEKEVLGMGIKNKDIHVIPSGYAVSRFRPMPAIKCRKKLSLPADKKIILFVGYLAKRKGVEYLIKALRSVVKANKNVLCCIVGDGRLKNELMALSDKLNLKGHVFFAGMKNPEEIPLWMNACDVLALPSLNEGLPNVLSEALACGKPVVATNVAGNPEIVTKDVGYLVRLKDENDLAEKILWSLNRKWDRKKLLKRAHEFSVTNSVEKTMKVYESVLKAHGNKTDSS